MGEAANPTQKNEPVDCCSCRFIGLLSVFVGGVAIVLYLLTLPKSSLDAQYPDFRLVSAAVSPCPLTPTPPPGSPDHYLTATWDLTLAVTNTNPKLGLYYETHQAYLYYGDEQDKDKLMLATTPLPLLALTQTQQTTLNITMAVEWAYVGDDVARELLAPSSEGGGGCYGSARLGVNLKGYFRFNTSVIGLNGPVPSNFFCDLFPPNNATDCKPFGSNTRNKC